MTTEFETMPDNATDRPLVTFALFAYNQEKFIREAVKGALAQTYQPLEIILSDDCSQDSTFDIIAEMAAEYRGPHTVRAEQTHTNLGVINHVFLRGRQAQGDIVVLAAGDDVSRANRCERHVAAYKDPSVFGVSTAYDLIDDQGEVLAANVSEPAIPASYGEQIRHFTSLEHPYVVVQGSTSSYRRSLFDVALPPVDLTFAEDNYLNFLIYAQGYRVAFVDKSLVYYRTHSGALGNKKVIHENTASEEEAVLKSAVDLKNKMSALILSCESISVDDRVNFAELQKIKCFADTIIEWPKTTAKERFISVLASIVSGDRHLIRWKLARLFGNFPFYQPRSWLKGR